MSSLDCLENNAVVQFSRDLDQTPTEEYKVIQETKQSSVNYVLVFSWYKRFADAEASLKVNAYRRKPEVTDQTP